MEKALPDPRFSDVKIKGHEGIEFNCHRIILSARCPFQGASVEKRLPMPITSKI
jgi:hypothetical protein